MHRIDTYERQDDTLDPSCKEWKSPFISAGGYTHHTKRAFEVSVSTGNLISFGRHFIANPDLVDRHRND